MRAKLSQDSSDPAHGDNEILATISVLLQTRTPFAICGRIIAVIVQAFNRVASWALAHVCKESGVIIPSRTNSDSSCPIVFERFVPRIGASLPHGRPDVIGFAESLLGAVSVFKAWIIPTDAGVFGGHGVGYFNIMSSGAGRVQPASLRNSAKSTR